MGLMKQRSTTPVSKTFAVKSTLIAAALVMGVSTVIQVAPSVQADQYDAQMEAINREIEAYEAEASKLNQQANTLQNRLDKLNAEEAAIKKKLALNETKEKQLRQQIEDTKVRIADNQDALGETIADMYVADKITPLEMLASSNNIGDYLDKQAYRSSIRDELTKMISEIKTLKAELEDKKIAVDKAISDQKNQKAALNAKQAEQRTVLAETRGKESQYQELVKSAQAELASVAAQQQAALSRITNNGQNSAGAVGSFEFRNYSGNQGPCGGGYPAKWCNLPLDATVDDWALYSRECVSYAAWAAETRFGKHVTSFSGMGHAYQWPSTASSLMGANVTNTPAVGSVAIAPQSGLTPLGHAMVVESEPVNGWVRVSQYNFGGTGEYSTMDLKVSSAVYVHFQN